MKILYVSAYDAPRGQSARTYFFAKELAKRGHDVTFITNGFNHFTREEYLDKSELFRVEMIDGIRTIWLKTYPYKTSSLARIGNMISNAIMIYCFHKKSNIIPEIVIGPTVPPFTAFSGYFIAKKYKAKFLVEIRDPWPEILVSMGNFKKNSLAEKFFRFMAGFLYKNSNHIITTLSNVEPLLQSYSVSMNKTTLIPNPIEVVKTTIEHQKKGEKFLVTYVGGFGFGQDINTMLEMTKYLENEDIFFKFVGAPQNELKKFEEKYGTEKVKIYPVVLKNLVNEILFDSDVLISAHKDDGAFQYGINSNKLHDYLGAGKPIVFSANAPGNPVELSGAGFVVKPENPELMAQAILKIKNMSQKERDEMGAKGRKYAEEYLEVGKLTDKLEDLLTKLLNGD